MRSLPLRRPVAVVGALAAALALASCGIGQTDGSGDGGGSHAPGTPSPTPSPDPIARLSIEQRVGQLFIVGSAATAADPATISAVRDRHVGGVFLSGRSTAGVDATAAVSSALTGASGDGIPVVVSTDQEGGQVQVLRGAGFDAIPSAVDQGRMSTSDLRRAAAAWGGQLRAAGVRLDLAPVADVVPAGTESRNAPVGALERQYGSDATAVEQHAEAFAAGLRDAGVQATAKHFPGLGMVAANTDTTAGVTDPTTGADSPSALLYRDLAASGVDAAMMSTAIYPRLDGTQPAAFSPAAVGVLRKELGASGVIVTDDLSGATQVAATPAADRATRAIAAGVDLVLVSRTPSVAAGMIDAVVAKAKADAGFRARVDAAARRVVAWKSRHLGG